MKRFEPVREVMIVGLCIVFCVTAAVGYTVAVQWRDQIPPRYPEPRSAAYDEAIQRDAAIVQQWVETMRRGETDDGDHITITRVHTTVLVNWIRERELPHPVRRWAITGGAAIIIQNPELAPEYREEIVDALLSVCAQERDDEAVFRSVRAALRDLGMLDLCPADSDVTPGLPG